MDRCWGRAGENRVNTLVCLGFGYSAQHYVALHGARFDRIIGTTRTAANAAERAARRFGGRAVEMTVFDGETAEPALVEAVSQGTQAGDTVTHGHLETGDGIMSPRARVAHHGRQTQDP